MTKKIVAILLATLMSATMFASIGVADIDVEIPEDAPEDMEIPDVLPNQQMINIDDKESKSRRNVNLDMSNFGMSNTGGDYTYVHYRVYNTGTDDITETFYDYSYLKYSGSWHKYPGTDKTVNGLDSGEYYYHSYTVDFPQGWYWFCADSDTYDDVDDEYDETDNYIIRLHYFV